MTASDQMLQNSKAVVGSDDMEPNNQSFLPDTTFAPVQSDSTFANLDIGWQKTPGQMPVYFFALPPNSMPILTMPLLDEKMIIPGDHAGADSLKTSDPDER